MKAVVIYELGDASVLQVESDYPIPEDLEKGHLLIKNDFAGLNFIDTYYRTGLYQQALPFVAGQEGGGVVVKSKSPEFKEGDRVVYMAFGSYAEYTKAPADKVVKVPDSLDMKVAVASTIQGFTAHYLVTDATAGLITENEWCLIFSVGSGTTQWAAQMAKLQGYKVIGTVSKTKIGQIAKHSIDELIVLDTAPGKTYANYGSIDIVQKVREITSGQGCKCVIDGVGKSTADISIACLARRGIWVSFGNASGPVPDFKLLQLTPKSGFVTRPKLGDYVATREELDKRSQQVFSWILDKKLDITVDKIFMLDQASEAHIYLESGQSKGKVLFKI
jgi:NADPH2:quinone reductase